MHVTHISVLKEYVVCKDDNKYKVKPLNGDTPKGGWSYILIAKELQQVESTTTRKKVGKLVKRICNCFPTRLLMKIAFKKVAKNFMSTHGVLGINSSQ